MLLPRADQSFSLLDPDRQTSDEYYTFKLIRAGFVGWRRFHQMFRKTRIMRNRADAYFENRVVLKAMVSWTKFVSDIYSKK
jgi:hypothetical protein